MCIPAKWRPKNWKAKRGRPVVARQDGYRQRFKVERSFTWLGNFRRLLIRWSARCRSTSGSSLHVAMARASTTVLATVNSRLGLLAETRSG